MSMQSDEVVEGLLEARRSNRLAHAYLFCGRDQTRLEALCLRLVELFLGKSPVDHPDLHIVRPESRSRRIRIEQMRDLEKDLQLKSYHGGDKIALIVECERMCLSGAEAANAFLKTLEEPPAGTLILLTSTEPQLILPTILSRCVTVSIHEGEPDRAPREEWQQLYQGWFAEEKPGPLRAYRRATLLTQSWQEVREVVSSRLEKAAAKGESVEEDVVKSAIEAEVLLGRKRSIAMLQTAYWEQERIKLLAGEVGSKSAILAVRLLEELNQSLLQNVEQSLAVERTCLLLEGAVIEGG